MNEPREITIEVAGATIAARVFGPDDGLPVLALHGWQDNAASFDLLLPHIVGGRAGAEPLRVVAIDLVGHGRSTHRPPGVAYTFLDWTLDVHAVLDALAWPACAILGHSLGAGIANALAAAWPARVRRIAAIDGFAPRTDDPADGPRRLADHAALRERFARAPLRELASIDEAAARLCDNIRGLTKAAAQILATRGTRELEGRSDGARTWCRDPRIQAGPPMRLDREQIRAFLRNVHCPVLMVRPRAGWPIPAEILDELRALVPTMRIEFVDGGHHVHLEHPQVVAAHVGPFLREM